MLRRLKMIEKSILAPVRNLRMRNRLDRSSIAQSLDATVRTGSLRVPENYQFDLVSFRGGTKTATTPPQSCCAANVLQAPTVPSLKPIWNQRWRCSAVPCVNESGTT
jgi:hypothetical protein